MSKLDKTSVQCIDAVDALVAVVQSLSQARSVLEIAEIVRHAARTLTGADGATFVLRDGDQCHYLEEDAITPLWKGKRFPMKDCISGWAMMNKKPAVIPDIYQDERIPVEAYRPTFVKSLVMVPIRREKPIGAIGNYWANNRQPTQEEINVLQALADATSVAMENAGLYQDLQEKIKILESHERTMTEQRDSLELFTHALAHDLREPLRTIQSFAQLIHESNLPQAQTDKYIDFIRQASTRMTKLVDAVFEYIYIDAPEKPDKQICDTEIVLNKVREDLGELISDAHAMLTHGLLPLVIANPTQLSQIFQNLISNAIIHNPEGVSIHVSAEEKPDHYMFSVSDDGRGVPEEYRIKIFEPFKRLSKNEHSLGLGLTFCQKIINQQGGDIWCEANKQGGVIFKFTLPISEKDNIVMNKANNKHLANVLIVDDSEADIEMIKYTLIEKNSVKCNLSVSQISDDSLALIKKRVKEGMPFDLIILDINMPGMDGLELLEKLRADPFLKNTPVIVHSGSNDIRNIQRAMHLGAIGFLKKPISYQQFERFIGDDDSFEFQIGNNQLRLMASQNEKNSGI